MRGFVATLLREQPYRRKGAVDLELNMHALAHADADHEDAPLAAASLGANAAFLIHQVNRRGAAGRPRAQLCSVAQGLRPPRLRALWLPQPLCNSVKGKSEGERGRE